MCAAPHAPTITCNAGHRVQTQAQAPGCTASCCQLRCVGQQVWGGHWAVLQDHRMAQMAALLAGSVYGEGVVALCK